MTDKTLFLAWQDKRLTREWFPVGRLDVPADKGAYRFRYIKGAERARSRAGFDALMDFPDWHKTYESSVLFPLFMNRIIPAERRDFHEYLRMLGLPEEAEPAEILRSGRGLSGHRQLRGFSEDRTCGVCWSWSRCFFTFACTTAACSICRSCAPAWN